MTKPNDEYGLLIERVQRYGTDYIEVRVCRRREEDGDRPLGCPGDGEDMLGYGCPKHLLGLVVDGLGMYGFVTDLGEPSFIAHDVEFRDVHSMGARKLGWMLKAIKRVNAQIEKDKAYEPGDKFMSFAKALKLSFAMCMIGERRHNVTPEWRVISLEEGRNYYRQAIEKLVEEAKAKKAA